MNQIGTLLVCLVLAWLLVAAFWPRKKRTWFSGFMVKGKDGRIGLTLMPVRKRRRRRR